MKKLILLFSLFCFGCASEQHGQLSTSLNPEGKELEISADPLADYSDDTNIYLDFSIVNHGSRWLKISQVSIDFPTVEHVVHNVIVGDDLKVWAESLDNKRRVSEHNNRLGSAAVMLGGLVVAILGARNGNSGLVTTGLATSTAGMAWETTRGTMNQRDRAQNAFMVPETYLLAPFTVPSQGLIRRWILVNVPERQIAKKAILTLTTIEGEKLRYEIPIVFHNQSVSAN
jgi:hypothetical protein